MMVEVNITLTGVNVTQDTKNLAFELDNLTSSINVTVDTDSDFNYQLYVEYPKNCGCKEQLYNIINLNRVGNVCSVDVTADMLPFNGKYTMQLVGTSGQKRYHSKTFDAWVQYSIDPDKAYEPMPSAFTQTLEAITELNQHPPKPDPSGYWAIWNLTTKQYELSDIPTGVTLPDISEATAGLYLSNDGTTTKWQYVSEVPAMSEETKDKILSNDGESAQWIDPPENGVTSIDGQKGDLTLKTVNDEELLGEGNIVIDKASIGLENVDNVRQYSAINPPPYPVTKVNGKTGVVELTAEDVGADEAGAAEAVQGNLNEHIDDKTNPHNVTKAQVGLGNVDNTSDANKPVSTAQAQAIGVVQDDLNTHIEDMNNPHEVTKAQVGLGNVTNTSDMDKPVSTAQAAAIGAVQSNLDNEIQARENADNALGERIDNAEGRIETIEGKIPNQATADNQLADKAFVNSSINQAAAFFRGNYATRANLLAVAWQTTDPNADYYVSNNDYAVVLADETHNGEMWRYLYVLQQGGTDNGWTAQYKINNNPFTQAQMDAINSGVTEGLVEQIGANEQNIADHLADLDNPHNVTKSQVGLSNVANERQYSANNPPPADNNKADKVTGAVANHFAALNASGNLIDSGYNALDFIGVSDLEEVQNG